MIMKIACSSLLFLLLFVPSTYGELTKEDPSARVYSLAELSWEISVKRTHQDKILESPGVLGVGVGLEDKKPVVIVVVDKTKNPPLLPKSLQGVSVVTRQGTPFSMTHGGSGCGTVEHGCHSDPLAYPVRMGVSTGHSAVCDAGTLGFKACDPSTAMLGYVTANHVAASFSTAGGNCPSASAVTGYQQIHPGSFEYPNCDPSGQSKQVGTLLRVAAIEYGENSYNKVDAAFVASDENLTSHWIEDIGEPSMLPGTPDLNECVMKSGRTTGLTYGRVTIVDFSYTLSDHCGTRNFHEALLVWPDRSAASAATIPLTIALLYPGAIPDLLCWR